MNVLNKLTINSLKLNKKRTIVTIIGIMLSVALMTAVTTMYQSLCTSLVNYEKSLQGDFHATFKNVDKDDIENIKNNRSIEKANFTKEIGFAKLETKNEYKPYACIIGVSEDIYDEISIRLKSGRFPDNDSEIVIPTHLKTNGKYNLKIGDKIELEVGKRVSNDGEEWNQGNPYMLDEETNEPLENIVDTVKKEYTVVGLIERPSRYVESYSAPGYSFFTKIDKIEGNADAYCRWKKSAFDTFYKDIASINGIDSELFEKLFDNETYNDEKLLEKCNKEVEKMKYKTDFNTYLLQLEDHPLTSDSNESILHVIIIVLVIIVVSSVFCIKNSFDISITEKIR
ncbi:MAG: ABC transporter permease, partial [Lachnospiraceae bacterium]|nr:ABC transporter permease [Lachnospiraceae bacterium]